MKILIIPITVIVFFNTLFQTSDLPIDPETKKVTYSEVIELKGVKKATINSRINSWAKGKKYFPKPKQDATSYAFKGTLVIVYPGATTGKNDKGNVEFIGTVYPKDGKYKYVFTNFKHVGLNGRGSGGALENEAPECGKYVLPLSSWTKIKQEVNSKIPEIIEELKVAASGAPTTAKKKNPADF